MDKNEEIKEALNELKNTKGVEGALAVSRDGLLVYSAKPRESDPALSAMAAAFLGVAEITGALENRGIPDEARINLPMGRIIVKGAGPKVLLVVITISKVSLVLLREIERTAEKIKQIME